ncbi:MAG: hypothetical protein AB9836_04440 [Aminipila sp.]
MKKAVSFVLCFVLVLFISACSKETDKSNDESKSQVENVVAEEYSESDFRYVAWGASEKEILNSEPTAVKKDETHILAETDVLEFPASILYDIEDSKLVGGSIFFNEELENDYLYLTNFNKIATSLKEKYGEPVEEEPIWTVDSKYYADNQDQYGTYIRNGWLIYKIKWQTETAEIGLIMYGENDTINTGIVYTPLDRTTDTKGI